MSETKDTKTTGEAALPRIIMGIAMVVALTGLGAGLGAGVGSGVGAKDALLKEFKSQTKEITVKNADGVSYIPKQKADSVYDLSPYFEDINKNRKVVLDSTKKKIVGYTYD